jgi:hypothetical protein
MAIPDGDSIADPAASAVAAHRAAMVEFFAAQKAIQDMCETASGTNLCDQAEKRLFDASEIMLETEKTLERVAPTAAERKAASERYLRMRPFAAAADPVIAAIAAYRSATNEHREASDAIDALMTNAPDTDLNSPAVESLWSRIEHAFSIKCEAERTLREFEPTTPEGVAALKRYVETGDTEPIPFQPKTVLPDDEASTTAGAFVQACQAANPEAFCEALDGLGNAVNAWDLALHQIAGLPKTGLDIQIAFLNKWRKTKWLSYRAQHDAVLASALRGLLPASNYHGPPIRLFRGEATGLAKWRGCGVSWTTRLEIAKMFARLGEDDEGSLVLETVAPVNAVLFQRKYGKDNVLIKRYGGEDDEYIVDPSLLTEVKIVERRPGSGICGGMAGRLR